MSSTPRRFVMATGIGTFIFGKISADGDYKLLKECYELVSKGDAAVACAGLPDSIGAQLYFMLAGLILVLFASEDPPWLRRILASFKKSF